MCVHLFIEFKRHNRAGHNILIRASLSKQRSLCAHFHSRVKLQRLGERLGFVLFPITRLDRLVLEWVGLNLG